MVARATLAGPETSRETTASPAASAARPLLEIRNLHTQIVSHGRLVDAVDGVDLSIGRGEILALVGESGSGKTMTALSVMRLLPPQARIAEGFILFDGVDLMALRESQMNRVRGAKVGLLFQQPRAALDPTSKIGSQVAETMIVHRNTRRRHAWKASVDLLADVGIAEPRRRARSYAHQMSGGMAQRVMIAAALSGKPDLLIADEPTTSLDVTVQAQILKLLVSMRAERGLSILVITHDLGIVSAVADRVAVMYAGRIVEEAPVDQIFAAPQHPYTRALLQASLLAADQHGRLYTIPGNCAERAAARGCRFCDRCSLADELDIRGRCTAEEPELLPTADKHSTRCWAVGSGS
jgi:peptide/nickel transport system ATP-binding protein